MAKRADSKFAIRRHIARDCPKVNLDAFHKLFVDINVIKLRYYGYRNF